MPIETINIGNIANDGTGDDLREAFRKVNDNFENLDLRFPTAATGVNLGSVGEGIFASAENSQLRFKKIIAGTNINFTANETGITLDVPNTELITVTNSGTVILDQGETLRLWGEDGITTVGDNTSKVLTIRATNGVLSADGTPTLSANLDANSNSINNANQITATTFSGALEGLVYGVDIRDISTFFVGFDFGNIERVYTNAISLILGEVDVDFGTFNLAQNIEVDLGSIT